MGWFDEQIRERKEQDDLVLEEAFVGLVDAVLGTKMTSAYLNDETKAEDAIHAILKYYKVKAIEVPDSVKGLQERLEYLLRPHGIMRRRVKLQEDWYKDAIGAFLGTRKDDGSVVAFIPQGLSGYVYFDTYTGKWMKINKKNRGLFDEEAICFYKPFPLKKLNIASLMKYIVDCLSVADFILIGLAALAVTLVGMLMPKMNSILFDTVAESGNVQLLTGITVFTVSVTISSLLLNSVKVLMTERINVKMNISVQAATMMRILSLPADFFKKYNAGELSTRIRNIQMLCSMLTSIVFNVGLTSIFSLLYITQIFSFAPALAIPALVIILVTLTFSLVTTIFQMRYTKKSMEMAGKESGMSYAMITGIQKLRLAGAEKRAFARWAELYAEKVKLIYQKPIFLRANGAFSLGISLVGTMVMYYLAVESGVSVAEYYAFSTAYGVVSGAFMALTGITSVIASIKSTLEMASPILETVPEVSEGKLVIDRLSGNVELNNISFRYSEHMPLVIDDLTVKIRAGQYVAIVGETGCGKSTLLRLLLGFEKAQRGSIYYDGKDINSIDLKSLRKKIGVVMQNGRLFQGDIYSNITIAAPHLTLEDAWEAAEMSGIAEDIRRMPMGMHTVISEGSGGVSGGQKQRLMIARAIAPKPKILMFDEATSALDNITQKIVSDSLEKLKCTRIVIAHRLSTIKECDRILYLEKGKIVEDGTYEELLAKNGRFAELIERQRMDI